MFTLVGGLQGDAIQEGREHAHRMGQEQAVTIAVNVSAVIGICFVASLVLTALFGIGSGGRSDESGPER